ncbi:DUF3795 domain-containing protein [Methanothrix sp.]|uniref:DUF3795 domain-containing protein n=1 Tax=Methanothrix sp. TaxID=90426 RepID=UPI003299F0B8
MELALWNAHHHMLFILAVDLGLAWMETHARCAGCENVGGPPDCTIRVCAREKGYDLCSS